MQERTQHPERQESHGFLQMVRINGLFLQYVPMEQRSEEVCLTAIEEDAFAYQFVPEPLKQRSAYLAECTVSGHGHVLEHVPEGRRSFVCVNNSTRNVHNSVAERWLGFSLQRFGSDKWAACRLIRTSCRCRGGAQGGRSPTGAAPRQRRLHAATRDGRWSR